MKRLLIAIVVAVAAKLITGCDSDSPEDALWDINSFSVNIELADAAGNNLLDSVVPNSMAKQRIFAIYDGQTYEKDSIKNNEVKTRFYYVEFEGLKTVSDCDGKPFLEFGPFIGHYDFIDKQVIIAYEDESKEDTIMFNHTVKWKNDKPQVNTDFFLNGKQVETNRIRIVK